LRGKNSQFFASSLGRKAATASKSSIPKLGAI